MKRIFGSKVVELSVSLAIWLFIACSMRDRDKPCLRAELAVRIWMGMFVLWNTQYIIQGALCVLWIAGHWGFACAKTYRQST
jgi:hypothetical protein